MLTLCSDPYFDGAPNAIHEENLCGAGAASGYPTFVLWRARGEDGCDVNVKVGFPSIRLDFINMCLRRDRKLIEAAAIAAYSIGDKELVLLAV